jgi:hypothetical protein
VVIAWREPPDDKQVELPLGPVRVTIDDLSALLSIIAEVTGCAQPRVKFGPDAGFFTAARDLRDIPKELRAWFEISTPELTVTLAGNTTEARGNWEHAVAIRERWARPRRTSRGPGYVKPDQTPRQRPSWKHRIRLAAAQLVALSAFAYLCFQMYWTSHLPTPISPPLYMQLFSINLHILKVGPYIVLPLSIIFLIQAIRARRKAISRGWARILPVTLEQFKSRPDLRGLLQLAPVVTPAIAVVVSIVFGILKH